MPLPCDPSVATPDPDAVVQLGSWALFAAVPGPILADLARHVRRVHVARGELLFTRMTPATCFYGVVDGLVQLSVSSADGSEKVVELIRPGQTLGEAVMFLGRRFPVDARALADSVVLQVPASAIDDLFDREPGFARSVVASLSMRLHSLIRDVEMYSLHSATERVVGHLLGHLHAHDGTEVVVFTPSKGVVANRLGMKPETLSRVLRELSDAGLVVSQGRGLRVPDAAALAALLSPS